MVAHIFDQQDFKMRGLGRLPWRVFSLNCLLESLESD